MTIVRWMALAITAAFLAGPASAQEACQPSKSSCTGMYQSCQTLCATATNPARCAASTCEISVTECRATGIWKARSARAACWTTQNRT